MASHLVSQHQLSSYASPVNGQAGDATVVLGNDNTTVTGYNSHDADGTIHVQDSSAAVFAATPAGTQGRKWMTNDSGGVYLYFDSGSAWVEVNYLRQASTGAVTITSTSASALAVGRQGATDPVFKVNANTASVATGVEIVGAAAGGAVNVRAISSATDESLVVNAKGTGGIAFGTTSTGNITSTRLHSFSAGATIASGQTLTLTGATVAGTPTWSSSQAITLSTAAQPNVTSVGTLTSLSVGAITSTGMFQTTLTTEQARYRYDASNYVGLTVSSSGVAKWDANGSDPQHAFACASLNLVVITSTTITLAVPVAALDHVTLANNKFLKGKDTGGTARNIIGLSNFDIIVLGAGSSFPIQWNDPTIALGGGSTPTLGTIGGSGPATAGQNSWLRVLDSSGNPRFIPVWA